MFDEKEIQFILGTVEDKEKALKHLADTDIDRGVRIMGLMLGDLGEKLISEMRQARETLAQDLRLITLIKAKIYQWQDAQTEQEKDQFINELRNELSEGHL